MDMRFGMWNVRSLYRGGLFMIVDEELSKYELDLVAVQEVRWDRDKRWDNAFKQGYDL
jgi:exonuclease III